MSIEHAGEPKGNAIRAAHAAWVGRAGQTYTPTQMVVARAEGAELTTADGHRLIDFTSGVLVCNLGYAHPGFERRYGDYLGELPRNAYSMITSIQVEASRRLVESIGLPTAEKVLWAASGSEGIQKAMWAALHRYPDRPIMAATRGGFHGKKGLANDVTGVTSANPNVRFVSFPMDANDTPAPFRAELDALWEESEGGVALFITEPYLGAHGSYHPPAWYHPLVQEWCRAHEVPLIFDEVQACFGRTGNMYAFESYGVEPDLVVLGKGMASGEPAAAVVGRADLIDALDYGEASDTFSGTPMACAAVCATLDVFEEERIVDGCRALAPVMRDCLEDLAARFPFIRAVRGEGLVYGVEMDSPETANRCVLEAYRGESGRGVHFLGPLAGKVIRVSPPLNLSHEALDEARDLLCRSWARLL